MRFRIRNGFTIIEILVVITALGIIASVLTVNYLNIQRHSRDSKRLASAIIVSESLERYYSQKGEYPSVATVTNPDAALVKQVLSVPTINSLLGPSAQAGSNINAWKSGTASATNQLTYTPNTDTSASCLTGSAAADNCIDYRLQYYKEETGTVETIISRNKAMTAPAAPTPPTIAAPTTPTITAALSGSNAVGTRSDTSCRVGAQLQYAFHWRMNDGAWSSYTAWDSTTASISTPATQGVKYGFQVKAKCVEGDYSSVEAISDEATYTHQITTPAAPIVTESTSGDISTWTWNTTVCPAGTTARYQYRFVADWGYTSVWYGPYTALNTRTWDTSSQGYEYIVQVQTHCYTPFTTSNWSATGQDNYIRPVTAPTGITFSISRAAADVVHVKAGATCHTSVSLYSRADPHTWDYLWQDTQAYGWYANSHGGIWTVNAWGFNGNPVVTGATNAGYGPFATGSRWNIAADLMCRNVTTGRGSTTTGRVESPVLYMP